MYVRVSCLACEILSRSGICTSGAWLKDCGAKGRLQIRVNKEHTQTCTQISDLENTHTQRERERERDAGVLARTPAVPFPMPFSSTTPSTVVLYGCDVLNGRSYPNPLLVPEQKAQSPD